MEMSFFQSGNGKLLFNVLKTSDWTANYKTFHFCGCAFSKMIKLMLESTRRKHLIIRSSLRRCSIKKLFVKSFTKFTGKHLRWSLFLITGQRLATLLNSEKFLRTFFTDHFPVTASESFSKTKFVKTVKNDVTVNYSCLFSKDCFGKRNYIEEKR